jgi:hypothetical protein
MQKQKKKVREDSLVRLFKVARITFSHGQGHCKQGSLAPLFPLLEEMHAQGAPGANKHSGLV